MGADIAVRVRPTRGNVPSMRIAWPSRREVFAIRSLDRRPRFECLRGLSGVIILAGTDPCGDVAAAARSIMTK